MEFYNNEPYLGIVLLGIIIAMEEERAVKGNEVVPLRRSPPLKLSDGAFGRYWRYGQSRHHLYAVSCHWRQLDFGFRSRCLGALVSAILMVGGMAVESIFMINLGYKFGRSAVNKILDGGFMNTIISAAAS